MSGWLGKCTTVKSKEEEETKQSMGQTLSKKRQTQITANVSQQLQFPFMPDEEKGTLDVMVMFLSVRFPSTKRVSVSRPS